MFLAIKILATAAVARLLSHQCRSHHSPQRALRAARTAPVAHTSSTTRTPALLRRARPDPVRPTSC
eukprot:6617754-Alexandrium_andersonii.AAC.1